MPTTMPRLTINPKLSANGKYRDFVFLEGKCVNRSRNLAGILRYSRNRLITHVSVADYSGGAAQLYVVFDNGAEFQTVFASGTVLRNWLRERRNWYGAPLYVNCQKQADNLNYKSPALIT